MMETIHDMVISSHPKLFRTRTYLACGPGWFKLINELCDKLEQLCETEEFYCTDCKEKFGTLRFYMSYSTDEMDKLIEEAEKKSKYICETCGEPGTLKLNPHKWWETTCEKHKTQRKNA